MMKKILMASFLFIIGATIFAMNEGGASHVPAVQGPQSPTPYSQINQTDSPGDIPSPDQARMRSRGVRRNLSAAFAPRLNPAIYTVLPRPVITLPNLNIHPHLIVNDWFFSHINDQQEALINRIAVGITQRQRILLSSEEYRLLNTFPTWITHELNPFVMISDDDLETTELVPSSESAEHSVKRSRKRNFDSNNPTGR